MTSKSYILYSALAALSAFAASVPQNSADKYYFTVPLHPGGIKGVVMGDPPDYRVMRSEDIDWLNEAAAERRALITGDAPSPTRALVPEFGKWPVTATNGFEGWASAVFYEEGLFDTNLVARYSYRTNDLSGSLRMIKRGPAVGSGRGSLIPKKNIGNYGGRNHYVLTGLGIENPDKLNSNYSVKEISGSFDWPTYTNIVTITVTNWTGIYTDHGIGITSVRTNISYITKTMTNGTDSVHTNMWVEILPHIETASITNVVKRSKDGMIFRSGIVELYEPEVPPDLEGPFRTNGIKEWYDALRNAKFNYYPGKQVVKLNEPDSWFTERWSQDGNEGTETNTIYNGTWGSKTVVARIENFNDVKIEKGWKQDSEGEWYEAVVNITPKERSVSYDGVMQDHFCSTTSYDISIPLEYSLVHTGGVTRVHQATLFFFVGVSRYQSWSVSGTSPNGSPISEYGFTNQDYIVCVRHQGNAQELPGGVDVIDNGTTNRCVAFRFNIEMDDLLDQAATYCRQSLPSYGYYPILKLDCPRAYINKDGPDPDFWTWDTGRSETAEMFSSSIQSAILVIEFKPWTSLSGW